MHMGKNNILSSEYKCYPTKWHRHLLFKVFLAPFCTGIYNCLCVSGFQKAASVPTPGQSLVSPAHGRARVPVVVADWWRLRGRYATSLIQPYPGNASMCIHTSVGGAWSAHTLTWSLETKTPVDLPHSC